MERKVTALSLDNVPKKKQTGFRWWVLAILCIVIYSFVYCYDNPYAIQNQLIDEYGLTQVEYNLLYSIYGWVNIVSPLIAGLLIDWIGINISTLLFYVLIVIGHTLWIVGAVDSISSFGIMLTGRAIFGVGAEQFHTSRKWILYEYFTGYEYYFASGLSLSFSRLGSASQSYASADVYKKHGIIGVLFVGWGLVVFSLILIVVFLFAAKYYQEHKNNNNEDKDKDKLSESLSKMSQKQQLKSPHTEQTKETQDGEETTESSESAAEEKKKEDKFNLDGLWKGEYDRRWWFLGFTLIFFYSTYLSYSNVGSAFLQNRYQYGYTESNSLAPIAFWIAAIFTPIFGFLCDYYGKREIMMVLSGLSLLLGHIFMGFIGNAERTIAIPAIGLVLLGMGYSLGAAAIWPSFGLIVKQKYLATTLGIWACIDNGFQASCFAIVGALTKDYSEEEREQYPDQYDDARWFWIALALATLFWTSCLWYSDAKIFNNILWYPEAKFRKKPFVDTTGLTDDDHNVKIDTKKTADDKYVPVATTQETDEY